MLSDMGHLSDIPSDDNPQSFINAVTFVLGICKINEIIKFLAPIGNCMIGEGE